jgi:putative NIF3 family GTP cyclohydrolase 1 type 2
MTVQEIIDRILADVPGERRADTVDTLKSGQPGMEVTGVVTTFIATREVLARAHELGANLVITHEPTYYSHRDETGDLKGDPVFESKRAFLEESGIAVWRFHDYWHQHVPDGILEGMVRRLGWAAFQEPEEPHRFWIPATTLGRLAATLKAKLGGTVLRAAGDPAMVVSGVALVAGACPWPWHQQALSTEGVDVLLCGESAEWQACEYVRDSAAAGLKKGLIVLGHCNSEEAGMEYLAEWLRPKLPGVAVTFVPAGDPFWMP